jgi:hypothetical protein
VAAAGGIVERDVETAVRVERARDHALDVVWTADVGRNAQRGAAAGLDLAGELFEAGAVACGQYDCRAGLGEGAGGSRADASAGAGTMAI